jgi:hypothetical protein
MTVVGEQEDAAWDAFVAAHPDGWLCHLSAWRHVVEESFPHIRGHLFVMKTAGDIRSGVPAYYVDSWLTGHRVVSVPFASLITPLVADPADGRQLLDDVLGLVTATGSRYFELRTMGGPGLAPHPVTCEATQFKHHFISLDASPEQIFKRFDRSCVRQRINRALASKLEVRTATCEADLREFYRLYLLTRRRLGLPPQPFRFLRALWTTFAPRGQVQVRLASHQGQAVSAIMLLRFRDRVSAEYMVSDDAFTSMSPNHLLFWDAIQSASREGYRIFDFGRTDEASTSLMDFKRRWGTEVRDLPVYYYGTLEPQTHDRIRPKVVSLLRTLCWYAPDPLLRPLGAFCYRHMG